MTIRILTICTGNICRSPLAAALLATKLDPKHFEVTTAGTSPVTGEHIQDTMQRIAVRMGATDVSNHRAIGITRDEVSNADLILGMDREHRRATAKLQPNAARRSFTLLEFAHVVSYIGETSIDTQLKINGNRPLAALETVMRMRGVVPRLTPDRLYDVPDPYGRSKQVYERSAKQIERAVDQIVTFFERASALTIVTSAHSNDALTPLDSE